MVRELKIADMTVRRDFQEMEHEELILRVPSGAKMIEKKNIHLTEKLEIAICYTHLAWCFLYRNA